MEVAATPALLFFREQDVGSRLQRLYYLFWHDISAGVPKDLGKVLMLTCLVAECEFAQPAEVNYLLPNMSSPGS